MPEISKNIELRSTEVQEIMSRVPSWMIRWGITLIFGLILGVCFLTWFIKYPDVISGNAVLSTTTPTTKLVSSSPGQIIQLENEDSDVEQGDVIAIIKSDLSPEAKQLLSILISDLSKALQNDNLVWNDPNYTESFGAFQAQYEELKLVVLGYIIYLEQSEAQAKIAFLKRQIINYQKLSQFDGVEMAMLEESVHEQEKLFESSERLYNNGVISKVKFLEERNQLKATREKLLQASKSKTQHSISLIELEQELLAIRLEHEKTLTEKQHQIESLLASLKSSLHTWGERYEIKAPFDGKIAYLAVLNKNQYVDQGKALFALVPNDNEYAGTIVVDKRNYGKIEKGQLINFRLDNYPDQEYGVLVGKVTRISVVPNENTYRVEFRLKNGMKTTYGKIVEYTPEMTAKAEIITEDMSLLERILNTFKKSFN